ncbi:PAS domain-containing protein, partial [Kineococcus sp. NUM-3379]
MDDADRLRWRMALAAGGAGTFDADLATGELHWDERLFRILGLDPATCRPTTATFAGCLHPEDRDRVLQGLEEALRTGAEHEAEYRVVRPDGEVRWVLSRGQVLHGAAGGPGRFLGLTLDVTAARADGTRLTQVLESMSAAFFSFDRRWRFVYVNAAAETLIGRPREELLGGVLWELFPHTVGSEFERNYRRAAETGEPVTFEAYYPEPLSTWYQIRAWPSADGVFVYCVDVGERIAVREEARLAREAAETARSQVDAERRRAEAAQRAADVTEQRLRLVAEASADLSATLDTEEAVARLAHLVVPELGEWCLISLVDDPAGRTLRDIGWWHADAALRPLVGRYAPLRLPSLAAHAPARRALASGRPVVLREGATRAVGDALGDEEARTLLGHLAPVSAVFLPLQAGGRTLGLLSLFSRDGERHTGPAVLETAAEVAARAALALDNARMYTQQQRLAEGLQRSLLTEPPEPDHLQITVRYQPAATAAQVGGDWYDAFL